MLDCEFCRSQTAGGSMDIPTGLASHLLSHMEHVPALFVVGYTKITGPFLLLSNDLQVLVVASPQVLVCTGC